MDFYPEDHTYHDLYTVKATHDFNFSLYLQLLLAVNTWEHHHSLRFICCWSV